MERKFVVGGKVIEQRGLSFTCHTQVGLRARREEQALAEMALKQGVPVSLATNAERVRALASRSPVS